MVRGRGRKPASMRWVQMRGRSSMLARSGCTAWLMFDRRPGKAGGDGAPSGTPPAARAFAPAPVRQIGNRPNRPAASPAWLPPTPEPVARPAPESIHRSSEVASSASVAPPAYPERARRQAGGAPVQAPASRQDRGAPVQAPASRHERHAVLPKAPVWAALWNRARAASARFDQICRSEKSVALPTDKRASPIASAPSDAGRDWPERARPASGGRKPATEGPAWVPLSSPTESPRAAAPMVRYTASAMPRGRAPDGAARVPCRPEHPAARIRDRPVARAATLCTDLPARVARSPRARAPRASRTPRPRAARLKHGARGLPDRAQRRARRMPAQPRDLHHHPAGRRAAAAQPVRRADRLGRGRRPLALHRRRDNRAAARPVVRRLQAAGPARR